MDRARKVEPRSNKLLYEAELRFRKECHDRKLRAVKASVDNKAPKGFGEVRFTTLRLSSSIPTLQVYCRATQHYVYYTTYPPYAGEAQPKKGDDS
jgi:hypothetical protein